MAIKLTDIEFEGAAEKKTGLQLKDFTFQDTGPNLKNVFEETSGEDSDQVAEIDRVSRKLNVDPTSVKENLPKAKIAAEAPDFQGITERAPVLAKQMGDPNFMIKSRDDKTLVKTEEAFRTFTEEDDDDFFGSLSASWDRVKLARQTGQLHTELGLLRSQQLYGNQDPAIEERIQELKTSLQSTNDPYRSGRSLVERAAAGLAEMTPIWEEGLKRGAKYGAASGTASGLAALALGQAGPQVAIPEELVTVPLSFGVGASVGMTTGSMQSIGEIEAGLALDEFYEMVDEAGQRIDPTMAKSGAAVVGVLNAAIEMAQVKTLLQTVPGADKVLRRIISDTAKKVMKEVGRRGVVKTAAKGGGRYVKVIATETGQEVVQELNNIIVGETLKNLSNAYDGGQFSGPDMAEIGSRLLETAEASALAFGLSALPGSALSTTIDTTREIKASRKIAKQEAFVADLRNAAEESTLKERDPDVAYKSFIDALAKEHGVEDVYLQAQEAVSAMGEAGMTNAEMVDFFNQYGVNVDDMVVALESGGSVKLATGTVIAQIGKDSKLDTVQNFLSQEAGGPSPSSLRKDTEDQKAARARLDELEREGVEVSLNDDEVHWLKTQMMAAGRTEDQASADSQVWAAWARVRGSRYGKTAKEYLKDRWGLQFESGHQYIKDADGISYTKTGEIVRDHRLQQFLRNSVVKNEDGTPMVLYHGTDAVFSVFEMERGLDDAHFFTADETHAETFGDNVMPVYVNITNPMEITQDDLEAAWDKEHPDGEQDDRSLLPRDFVQQFVAEARELGHDGLIVKGMADRDKQLDMYLPFTPNQIKSIFNEGTFNPEDANIMRQTGDKIAAAILSTNGPGINSPVAGMPLVDEFNQVRNLPEWKEKTRIWMEDNGYTTEEIQNHLAEIEAQMNIVAALSPTEIEILPQGVGQATKTWKNGAPVEGPIRGNSDPIYKISFDLSAMCIKRLEPAATASYIERQIKRPLSIHERMALVALFRAAGKDAPCLYCYIEAPRAKAAEFVNTAFDVALGEAAMPDTWADSTKAMAQAAKDEMAEKGLTRDDLDPSLILDVERTQDEDYNDSIAAAPQVYKFAQSQYLAAKANMPKMYEEYDGQILDMPHKLIEELNSYAGLRFFSSSDFQAEHVVDLMQALYDMEVRDARGHAYTKVEDFVEIFGGTGLKIQTSVFADLVDGQVVMDDTQGMDWDAAKKFRLQYPDVGTVLVAQNKEILEWGLDQDWIDFIIPFHASGLQKEFFEKMDWQNFTSGEKEKALDPTGMKQLEDKTWQLMLNGKAHGEPIATKGKAQKARMKLKKSKKVQAQMQKAEKYLKDHGVRMHHLGTAAGISDAEMKQRYMDLCEEKGLVPVFPEYQGHKGYAKLRKDYARTDTPFRSVKGKFDVEKAQQILDDFLTGKAPGAKVDTEIADRLLEVMRTVSKENLGDQVIRSLKDHKDYFEQRREDFRRLQSLRNRRVSDMTLEELQLALLSNELTGIPNRRAYMEATKFGQDPKPVQVSIDADSLKWVNDNIGHHAGDELLQELGAVLAEVGGENFFHVSGDEFLAQGDNFDEMLEAMERVQEALAESQLVYELPDGTTYTLNGIGVSYGIAKSQAEAEELLQQQKLDRIAQGLRADRGERPPSISVEVAKGRDAETGTSYNQERNLNYYSGLALEMERSIFDQPQMTAKTLLRKLEKAMKTKGQTVKQEEIDAIGLQDYLAMLGDKFVSKDDILAYIVGNGVHIREVVGMASPPKTGEKLQKLRDYLTAINRTKPEYLADADTWVLRQEPADPFHDILEEIGVDTRGEIAATFAGEAIEGATEAEVIDRRQHEKRLVQAEINRLEDGQNYEYLQEEIENLQMAIDDLKNADIYTIQEAIKDQGSIGNELLWMDDFLQRNNGRGFALVYPDGGDLVYLGQKPLLAITPEVMEQYRGDKIAQLEREIEDTRAAGDASEKMPVKFQEYAMQGGDDYFEHLLTVPTLTSLDPNAISYVTLVEDDWGQNFIEFDSARILIGNEEMPFIEAFQKYTSPHASEAQLKAQYDTLKKVWDNDTPMDWYDRVVANLLPEIRTAIGAVNRDNRPEAFDGGHWDGRENVVAHFRGQSVTTDDGKKLLFIDEIQSDWGLAGRQSGFYQRPINAEDIEIDQFPIEQTAEKIGWAQVDSVRWAQDWRAERDMDINEPVWRYRLKGTEHWSMFIATGHTQDEVIATILDPEKLEDSDTALGKEAAARRRGIAAGPYVSKLDAQGLAQPSASWQSLVLKRILTMAAEGGYDGISWTTGQQQADRYNLDNHYRSIEYNEDTSELHVTPKNSSSTQTLEVDHTPGSGKELHDYIGRELAERIQKIESRDGGVAIVPDIDRIHDRYRELEGIGVANMDDTERQQYHNFKDMLYQHPERLTAPLLNTAIGEGAPYTQQMAEEFAEANYGKIDYSKKKILKGEGLKSEAAWTRALYDRALPTSMKKIMKPFGKAEFSTVDLRTPLSRHTGKSDTTGKHFDVQPVMLMDGQIRDKILSEGVTYFQDQEGPLGSIAFDPERTKAVISIYEGNDFSTVAHEGGHLFLEDLKHGAIMDGVDVELWETIKTWLAIGDDNEITREQHEKFARGFEAYLREGKAPTLSLQGVFDQFKSWLTAIYRSIAKLDVELTDDVRSVFDQLLATEDEIAQAQEESLMVAMFDKTWQRDNKVSNEEAAAYAKLVGQVIDEAKRKVDKHKLSKKDERLKGYKAQAEEESYQVPIYRALYYLSRGVMPGEGSKGKAGEGVGLDPEVFKDQYGDHAYELMPRYPGLWKDGGVTMSIAAAEAGYENAQALVDDLKTVTDKPRARWIEERVQELDVEHTKKFKTEEAIRSELQRRMLEIESQWLEKRAATGRKALSKKALRRWAEQRTGLMKISEATDIYRLIQQSRNLRKKAIAAQRAGRAAEAFDLNEKVRMNEELIYVHTKTRKQLAKMEKAWGRMVDAKVHNDYRQQIYLLLSQYQLTKRALGNKGAFKMTPDEEVETLGSFMARILANATEFDSIPFFSEWLVQGTKVAPYKQLTWDELLELNDMLSYLDGRGREEFLGLLSDKQTTVAQVVEETTAPADKMKRRKKTYTEGSLMRFITDKTRTYFAKTDMLVYLFRKMDGFGNVGKKGVAGPNERLLWHRLAAARDMRDELSEKMHASLDPHIQVLIKSAKKDKDLADLPLPLVFRQAGRRWTWERVISVALNMGNAQNAERLLQGLAMTQEDLQAVIGILSSDDWKAVQGIWDAIDSLYPQIDKVHYNLNNFHVKKVLAEGFEIKGADGKMVTLNGGYYPLKYDPELSDLVGSWEEKDDILNSQEAMFQVPVAKSGFVNTRAESAGGLTPRLSLTVLTEHINDAMQYIAFAEAVKDIDRVTQNQGYKEAARGTDDSGILGRQAYRMIRPALAYAIRPTPEFSAEMDKWLDRERVRATAFILAWNVSVAVKQVFSVPGVWFDIGLGNYVKGVATVIKSPLSSLKAMHEMSTFMRNRSNSMDRDIMASMKALKPGRQFKGYSMDDVRNMGFIFIKTMDFLAVYPSWWGAYGQAMKQHNGDIDAAVRQANEKIRASQPSGTPIDLSGFQRQRGIMRLFTMFATFVMKYGNRQRESYNAFREGAIPIHQYMWHVWLEAVAPPLLMSTVFGLIQTGEAPEPEELARDVLLYQLVGLPFWRDLAGMFAGAYKSQHITSPAFTGVETVGEAASNLIKAVEEGDEEAIKNLAWSLAELTSFYSGVPVTRVYEKIMKGLEDMEAGTGTPINLFIPTRQN